MQSVSSRIWTRVAVSISYDDNHYTTGTSNNLNNKTITKTNVVYKSTCQFRESFSENNITPNTYISYTITTLSRRLTYHVFEIKRLKTTSNDNA